MASIIFFFSVIFMFLVIWGALAKPQQYPQAGRLLIPWHACEYLMVLGYLTSGSLFGKTMFLTPAFWLTVIVSGITFILLMKYVANRYRIPSWF